MKSIVDSNCESFLPKVLVLMATYNGESYLREQIDSILNQKGVEVDLLITDDCSTDKSYEIAQEYALADRRVISKRNKANAGVGKNFINMLYGANSTEYDYVAFSDQDDVWLDDKLAVACRAIIKAEEIDDIKLIAPFGAPILYCSDLQNVDERLCNPVLELRALGLDHSGKALPLMRNYYSGCTMVMNRAMVELFQSSPITEPYRIHDVWLALVGRYCANFIIDEDHARILRRISGKNTVGALTPGADIRRSSLSRLKKKSEGRCSKTAKQLYDGFGKYMNPDDRDMVKSFSEYKESIIARFRWAARKDYRAPTKRETFLLRVKLMLGRY